MIEWMEARRKAMGLSVRAWERFLGVTHGMWAHCLSVGWPPHSVAQAAWRRFPDDRCLIAEMYLGQRRERAA